MCGGVGRVLYVLARVLGRRGLRLGQAGAGRGNAQLCLCACFARLRECFACPRECFARFGLFFGFVPYTCPVRRPALPFLPKSAKRGGVGEREIPTFVAYMSIL